MYTGPSATQQAPHRCRSWFAQASAAAHAQRLLGTATRFWPPHSDPVGDMETLRIQLAAR
jgi:hypothetical protein